VPIYSISGRVYRDSNQNGVYDSGEQVFAGVTVGAYGPQTGYYYNYSPYGNLSATTASDGRYTIYNVWATGQYQVDTPTPAGFKALGQKPRITNIGPSQTNVDIRFIGPYTVSGNVFIDANRNKVKDIGNEANVLAVPDIRRQIAGGWTTQGITRNADGTYIVGDLTSGTYTISYQTLTA
jgi:hypothetical protein